MSLIRGKITFSPFLPSASLVWAIGFAILLVLLQLLPEPLHRSLWYDRADIAAGQWWRLLTGNLVHLGWSHLWLNVGALVIGTWIFYPARTPVAWLIALVVCSLAANAGLYWFSPGIAWCVGMSGALHGLLLIGAVDWLREGERLGAIFLVLWIGKLGWEQWQGALPFSSDTIGAPVVTDAHLWGSVGGVIYVAGEALLRVLRRRV